MKKTVFAILICAVMVITAPFTAFAEDLTDTDNNVTFSVSDNWVRNPESEDETIKFIFSDEAQGAYLEYMVEDIYYGLTDEAKEKYSREEIDNSVTTKEEIEKFIFGEDYSVTSSTTEKFNGYEYYSYTADVLSADLQGYKAKAYVHIYQCNMYGFLMFSPGEPPSIDNILNTVKFNNETGSNKTETDASKTAKNIGKSVLSRGLIRGIVIAIIALIGGGGGFFARMKAKRQAKKNPEVYQPQNNSYTPAQPQNTYTPAQPQNNNVYTPGAPQGNTYTPPAPSNPENGNVNGSTPASDTNNSYSNPFYNGDNQ